MKKFASLSTGVRIEYVEQGKADGVPVIFLHGVTDSWRSFERVLPLSPPGIHAFALSQRAHGDTSRPTSGYRFAGMSADLLAFLDAMGRLFDARHDITSYSSRVTPSVPGATMNRAR